MSTDAEHSRGSDWVPVVADVSAGVGAVIWFATMFTGLFDPVRAVVALALLVLIPLVVRLADTPRRTGTRSLWYRLAVVSQPVTALFGVVSLTVEPGQTAVLLALPWAATTAAIAGFGCWRLSNRGVWPIEEVSVDAGLLYVFVGGLALLLDRGGISLVFEPILVTLTVVHFHYAGSVLPVTAGLAGRYAPAGRLGRILRVTIGIIILGPGIIAVGITASALGLPLAALIELVAVVSVTTAIAVFSVAVCAGILPRLPSRRQQLSIGVASLSIAVSMGVVYGLARATGGTDAGIGAQSFGLMIRSHAHLNAYGFAVPALVGWRLAVPPTRARSPGIPFSRLEGGWRIGTGFLDRRGLTTDADVSGMVDRIESYASDGFDPARVAPSVGQFYERSGEYELDVEPAWAVPWRQLAVLYHPVAARIQQLSIPLEPVSGEKALTGRVVGVDADDQATGSRAWIRSNERRTTGDTQMTYVGIYDRYAVSGRSFLRVAFPLPGGTLTGILRVENGGDDGDGLVLSSYPAVGNSDDAGLYLVVRGVGIRLPLNETLVVEPDSGTTVQAAHRVELLGSRLFELQYRIRAATETTES